MKARVKATGHIIEVISYSGFDDYDYYEPDTKLPWLKSELEFDVTDKDASYNAGWQAGWDEAVKSEIPKIYPKLKGSDPDYWEKLEHQYAGMAMQGILSNPNIVYKDISTETICNHVAERVKEIAHALVEKYKKEK